MSGEKLYMVKNDEGSYIAVTNGWLVHWHENSGDLFSSYQEASKWATTLGGHVVTLIEEPEKVVLTKEQAKIVEKAHTEGSAIAFIFVNGESDDDELLMRAYVNGFTVAKEKKYNVKVPKEWSGDDKHYWTKEQDGALTWAWLINKDYMIPTQQFPLTEIEHYGLQYCEKEEVTDDEV